MITATFAGIVAYAMVGAVVVEGSVERLISDRPSASHPGVGDIAQATDGFPIGYHAAHIDQRLVIFPRRGIGRPVRARGQYVVAPQVVI